MLNLLVSLYVQYLVQFNALSMGAEMLAGTFLQERSSDVVPQHMSGQFLTRYCL